MVTWHKKSVESAEHVENMCLVKKIAGSITAIVYTLIAIFLDYGCVKDIDTLLI